MSASEPVQAQHAQTDDDAAWLELAQQTCATASVESVYVGASDDEREPSELPPTRSPEPDRSAPALAIRSANQHNDSTLRVTPLPAPNLAVQRVRVLPMAPRSSLAPLIAILCLLAAGLAIGVYFALPYVSDWYEAGRAPLQVDEARAPKSIVPKPAAADSAASIVGGRADVPPKPKAKRLKATKKKVGTADKGKKPDRSRRPDMARTPDTASRPERR